MTIETLFDIGQTVAVLASLMFVGIQIRQNTRALRAASHHAVTERLQCDQHAPHERPERSPRLAPRRGGSGEPRRRRAASELTIRLLMASPGFRAVTANVRPRLTPTLGALMDRLVAEGRAAPVIDGAAAWRAAAAAELAAMTPPEDTAI